MSSSTEILNAVYDSQNGSIRTGNSAVYNSTPPTLTNGQAGNYQLDSSGNLKTTLATGINSVDDSITTYPLSHSSTYISTATTTTIKTGIGHLAKIVITETAAGTITVYDNTAGSGTVLALFKASIPEGEYEFNIGFGTGLTIVTAATSKLTVVWR